MERASYGNAVTDSFSFQIENNIIISGNAVPNNVM